MPFQIPQIDELRQYIADQNKKHRREWPEKFIDYYSERFWNYYQAQGWRLSNNVPMKDWKAAFNSRWNPPKFQDAEILKQMTPQKRIGFEYPGKDANEEKSAETDRTMEFIQHIFDGYRLHPTSVDEERLNSLYDTMKQRKLLKLTKTEKEICQEMGEFKGKGQAVKFVFDKMAMELKSFI